MNTKLTLVYGISSFAAAKFPMYAKHLNREELHKYYAASGALTFRYFVILRSHWKIAAGKQLLAELIKKNSAEDDF